MPKPGNPRKGSMQFWPRKRATKEAARVHAWASKKTNAKVPEKGLLGFAGYKAGMTHVHYVDSNKNSPSKGLDVFMPVTVVECPPLSIVSVRFYKKSLHGLQVAKDILLSSAKDLKKKLTLPKKTTQDPLKDVSLEGVEDIRVMVATQPKTTGIGKKAPDLFEVALAGSLDEKLAFVKEHAGKPISVSDVFGEGTQVDVHGVTKGKGFQGPVKRFGVAIRHHKSEKTKRGPGSLGPWKGQQHIMYRVAHAGQMGYHLRTEYNKQIVQVGTNPDEVNPQGGFVRYGQIKGNYILLAGSVMGPAKRLIRFNFALHPDRKRASHTPEIVSVSQESKQR